MKILMILLWILPSLSFAHCPNEITANNQNYCLDIQWIEGEKKIKGQFQTTQSPSPHLIPMGEVPQKWIYSQAFIQVWQKDDTNHNPVFIEDFKVFPFMFMDNGHNHSTGHEFFYSEADQGYHLRRIGFQAMPGVWSLRWTLSHTLDEMQSYELLVLSDFANQESLPSFFSPEDICGDTHKTH